MSATDPKGGESSCEYPRDVYPARERVRAVEAHEQDIRRRTNDRWWRRVQALMPSDQPVLTQDFGTECTL